MTMRFLAAFATFTSAVAATGSSTVTNLTPEPFYLWVVPDAWGSAISSRVLVEAGKNWTEPFHVGRFGNSSTTTGVAIKLSKDQYGLYNSAPLQILGYALAGDRVWYNLDAVNGEPFKGRNVTVSSEGAPSIEWPNGEDIGDATRDNAADKDIVLVISGKA